MDIHFLEAHVILHTVQRLTIIAQVDGPFQEQLVIQVIQQRVIHIILVHLVDP